MSFSPIKKSTTNIGLFTKEIEEDEEEHEDDDTRNLMNTIIKAEEDEKDILESISEYVVPFGNTIKIPPSLYSQPKKYEGVISSKYIENHVFCYSLLYYVRNSFQNKRNKELVKITSEIAKYYKIEYAYERYMDMLLDDIDEYTNMNFTNVDKLEMIADDKKKTLEELLSECYLDDDRIMLGETAEKVMMDDDDTSNKHSTNSLSNNLGRSSTTRLQSPSKSSSSLSTTTGDSSLLTPSLLKSHLMSSPSTPLIIKLDDKKILDKIPVPKGFQRGTVNKCYLHSLLHMLLNNKRFCEKVLLSEEVTESILGFKALIIKYWDPKPEITSDDYAFIAEEHATLRNGRQEDVYDFFQILIKDFGLEDYIFKPVFYFQHTEHLITLINQPSEKNEYECALCLDMPLDDDNEKQLDLNEKNLFNRMVEYYFRYSLRAPVENHKLNQMKYYDTNISFNQSLIIRIGKNKHNNPLEKYEDEIIFPDQFMNYELKGFIVHLGGGISSGHYVYYGKNNDEWWSYNDSITTKLGKDKRPPELKKAYLLYYEKDSTTTTTTTTNVIENIDQKDYPSKIFDFHGSIGLYNDKQVIQAGDQKTDNFIDASNNQVVIPDKTKITSLNIDMAKIADAAIQDHIFKQLPPSFVQIVNDKYAKYEKKRIEIRNKIAKLMKPKTPVKKTKLEINSLKSSEDTVYQLLSEDDTLTFENTNKLLTYNRKPVIDQEMYDKIKTTLNSTKEDDKISLDQTIAKYKDIDLDIEGLTNLIRNAPPATFEFYSEAFPTLSKQIYDSIVKELSPIKINPTSLIIIPAKNQFYVYKFNEKDPTLKNRVDELKRNHKMTFDQIKQNFLIDINESEFDHIINEIRNIVNHMVDIVEFEQDENTKQITTTLHNLISNNTQFKTIIKLLINTGDVPLINYINYIRTKSKTPPYLEPLINAIYAAATAPPEVDAFTINIPYKQTTKNDGRVSGYGITMNGVLTSDTRIYSNKCAVIAIADGFDINRELFFELLQKIILNTYYDSKDKKFSNFEECLKYHISSEEIEAKIGVDKNKLFNIFTDHFLDMGEMLDRIQFPYPNGIIVIHTNLNNDGVLIFTQDDLRTSFLVGTASQDSMMIVNYNRIHFQLLQNNHQTKKIREQIIEKSKFFQQTDSKLETPPVVIRDEMIKKLK